MEQKLGRAPVVILTIGAAVAPENFVHGEAYANLVASFSRPLVAGRRTCVWFA